MPCVVSSYYLPVAAVWGAYAVGGCQQPYQGRRSLGFHDRLFPSRRNLSARMWFEPMYLLILTACLATSPQDCAPRMLPAGAAVDQDVCTQKGDSVSADWLQGHPDLTTQGWSCEPLDSRPALALENIAEGVWVYRGADEQISTQNRGRIANLGVVIGTERVAIIDPGGSREQGEALFTAIRAQTKLPIGPVILTHMHPDHIAGAEVFAEAGGEVIGHAKLPAALEARRETWVETIPAQIGAEAWAGTVLIAPTRTVAEQTVIDLGGTSLTLTPAETAHTETDLMVRDSRSDTLFTGDLVFRGLTPVVDGSLKGWLAWLSAPPEAALVVPGHGPIANSVLEAAADETKYLTALRDGVRTALDTAQGLSDAVPAVAAALVPLSQGWADFEATTARNIAAAYAEMEWD